MPRALKHGSELHGAMRAAVRQLSSVLADHTVRPVQRASEDHEVLQLRALAKRHARVDLEWLEYDDGTFIARFGRGEARLARSLAEAVRFAFISAFGCAAKGAQQRA